MVGALASPRSALRDARNAEHGMPSTWHAPPRAFPDGRSTYINRDVVSASVLVVEDDEFVRAGVVRQIERSDDFRVVAQAASLADAARAVDEGRASIGVFDLQVHGGSALDLIPTAVSRGMSILVLTVWDDDESVYQALAAGAGGYLLKGDAAAGRVTEALRTLLDGGAPISPTIARRLLQDFRLRAPHRPSASLKATEEVHRPSATRRAAAPVSSGEDIASPELRNLTDREREVIELFAKGATYDEVASMLSMSVNTVRHHVRSMYRKLHVCSKAEAISVAFRLV